MAAWCQVGPARRESESSRGEAMGDAVEPTATQGQEAGDTSEFYPRRAAFN